MVEFQHINESRVEGRLALNGVRLEDHRANEHDWPFANHLIN